MPEGRAPRGGRRSPRRRRWRRRRARARRRGRGARGSRPDRAPGPRGARRRSARSCSRCRRGCRTARGVKRRRLSRFCSFTASTPASFAALNSSFACSRLPWWLWPISAITKHPVSSPIVRPSIASSRTARSYPRPAHRSGARVILRRPWACRQLQPAASADTVTTERPGSRGDRARARVGARRGSGAVRSRAPADPGTRRPPARGCRPRIRGGRGRLARAVSLPHLHAGMVPRHARARGGGRGGRDRRPSAAAADLRLSGASPPRRGSPPLRARAGRARRARIPARTGAVHRPGRARRHHLPPHAGAALDPARGDRADRRPHGSTARRVPGERGDPPGLDDAALPLRALGRACSARIAPRRHHRRLRHGPTRVARPSPGDVRGARVRDAARGRAAGADGAQRPRRRVAGRDRGVLRAGIVGGRTRAGVRDGRASRRHQGHRAPRAARASRDRRAHHPRIPAPGRARRPVRRGARRRCLVCPQPRRGRGPLRLRGQGCPWER